MSDKVNNVTTRFIADVSSFLKDTQSMKRGIAQANAEFKNATAGMDRWQDTTEGLNAKLTQLNKVVQIEKKRLADMVAEYDELERAGKANTAEAQRLATQIVNQSTKVKKAEADIKKYSDALDELKNKSQNSSKTVKDVGDNAKDSAKGFDVAKLAIVAFVAGGLALLANAAKNAISNVLGLAEATREYRRTLATLDTAANDVGVSTDYIRDKFTDLMGVFNDEGSVTEGLNNLLTAGFDEKTLDDVTAGLEGAALKWKDTLKFEGLADSLQEWIGSGGKNLTGNFAELLERMGYNLEEVQEKTEKMTDEQRRTYVTNLLAAEGLNTVSESYREQNQDMVDAQKANVEYQNSLADLGAKVEPITTKIRIGFSKIVDKVSELVDNIDFEALGAKIEKAFDKVTNDILPALVNGLTWIINNGELVISLIVSIGAAFLAWKIVGIVQGVTKALKGMTIAQAALNLVMKMNPIGLVVAAIVGLIAAFVMLWKNCEGFRNFWINLWDNIVKIAKVAWEGIKGFFKAAWEFIKSIWNGAVKFFVGVWNGIQKVFSAVVSWFSNIFQKAWSGIKNAWSGVKNFFANIWSGIKNVFSSVGSWFGNIFKKAWSAIKNAFSAVGSFFGGIWETIKSKFTSIGTKVGDAIGGAFKKAINAVLATVEKAINAIPNAVNGAISKINELTGMNIGKMGTVSLPRLAEGGIVDKATIAQIGEAGREAVIPLEKNTQGLKEIAHLVAEEIGVKNGGGVTITNYNTFTGMRTTRYALHVANKQGEAGLKLLLASKGGV